jgi:hypothetical protein
VSGEKESWFTRAKKARADGLLASFLEEGLVQLLVFVLYPVLLICWFSLPIQAFGEALYWFKHAEFYNFDWYDLFGRECFTPWTTTDFAGLNKVLDWALDTWVSIIPSVTALVLAVVIGASRNQGY